MRSLWERLGRIFRRSDRSETERASHLKIGDWGEEQAVQFLKQAGFKILARNLRISTSYRLLDELDIVCRNATTLMFVEVKTRSSASWVRPAAAVDARKKRALRRAAIAYLARLSETPSSYRFDIIEVIGTPADGPPEIRHIKRAFPIHRQ